jgi:hypothetical protein
MVSCKVIEGGTDKDIGGKFNIYLAVNPEDFLEQNVAEWTAYATAWGISESKIYEDADEVIDVLGNILTAVNKLTLKTSLRLSVERKKQDKVDPKSGKAYYFNNIQSVSRVDTTPAQGVTGTTSAPAPATETKVEAPKKPWAK